MKEKPNGVGRINCPVCGADTEVRKNKNGILYTMSCCGEKKYTGAGATRILEEMRAYDKSGNIPEEIPKSRVNPQKGEPLSVTLPNVEVKKMPSIKPEPVKMPEPEAPTDTSEPEPEAPSDNYWEWAK